MRFKSGRGRVEYIRSLVSLPKFLDWHHASIRTSLESVKGPLRASAGSLAVRYFRPGTCPAVHLHSRVACSGLSPCPELKWRDCPGVATGITFRTAWRIMPRGGLDVAPSHMVWKR